MTPAAVAPAPATVACRVTQAEARLPAHLAAVGLDLYTAGWRLPTVPPRAYLNATKDLPIPRRKKKQGRYYLLLGAAALAREAIPPQARSVPAQVNIRLPRDPGPRPCTRLTIACARGLPELPGPVEGPYPHRTCLSLSLAIRCALEKALRGAPGTTAADWIRWILCG